MAATMTSLRSSSAALPKQSSRAVPFSSRVVCRAQLESRPAAEAVALGRRDVLLATIASLGAVQSFNPAAVVAEEEYATLIGYATPPTSYGGYGGNAAETPRYSFEYPLGWKQEIPNKVEKGTQGVDSRVVAPRAKDTKAFVISLSRAGEDGARFRLTDLESTLSSFAGADYDLQDAISGATSKTTNKRVDGADEFYEYDIDSPDYHYLSSIAVKNGKVFALFVRSPAKSFKANEEKLRHIINTFKLL